MRRVLPLFFLVFLLCGFVSAQSNLASPDQATVTIEARDQDIRDAVRTIFSKVNASFSVHPEVTGRVNLGLRNIPFHVALEEALRQVSASYWLANGIYIISPRVVTNQGSVLFLQNMEVNEALKRLPGRSVFMVEPGIAGQVTVVGDMGEEQAVTEIARQVDARVEKTETGFRLLALNSLRKPVPAIQRKNQDLRELVVDLMDQTGVSYIVSGGIVGRTTVNLGPTDAQSALEAVFAPIGGRIMLRRGIFIVSVR